jgi:hypothetical protein
VVCPGVTTWALGGTILQYSGTGQPCCLGQQAVHGAGAKHRRWLGELPGVDLSKCLRQEVVGLDCWSAVLLKAAVG